MMQHGDRAVRTGAVRGGMPAVALVLVVVGALVFAGSARADFGFTPGSFTSVFSHDVLEPASGSVVEAGVPQLQAGAHPDITTSFAINADSEENPEGDIRDLRVELPSGVIGNPNATPRCTMAKVEYAFTAGTSPCPIDTAVGYAEVDVKAPFVPGVDHIQSALIYNIVPYDDEPAAFGFQSILPVRMDTSVRTGSDYGINVTASNIAEGYPILATRVTFWGVPADHQAPGPLSDETTGASFGGAASSFSQGPGVRRAFLTNPTQCTTGAASVMASATPWIASEPSTAAQAEVGPFTGCEKLSFEPTVTVAPASQQAGAPTGYEVDIAVPQNENPDSLATPSLKDAKVVLPQGMTLSPAVANGLGGCSDAQFAKNSTQPSSCPDSAKVGSVSVDTPLLSAPLTGSAYIGEPVSGDRYRLFLSLEGSGVAVKLEGKVDLDPASGQITATFDDNPQLPFSALHLSLKGGPRAPLANPGVCGSYPVLWELTPYSSTTPVTGSTPITVDEGCAASSQFTPALEAGASSPSAGAFSAFTLRVTRGEDQQNISRIDATLPEGELANLAGVPLCEAAQAASNTCPQSAQVGTTTVGVGNGTSPLYVPQPGRAPTAVYLAGPYKGAPYSLLVSVPAQAGPYDLGTIAVRAGIYINPETAQVTVKSDALPQILEGIPLSYRDIRVEINHPAFTFNPTSCQPTQVTSTITSITGTSSSPASPYQAANCAALAFKPALSAATTAKTSKADGTSLHVKLAPPHEGPQSSAATSSSGAGSSAQAEEANIARVKIELPTALPSRLTTLQRACTAGQFDANPAGCPKESVVGSAIAHTPLLKSALIGPAYFVSHGNEAFPQLVIVLQGEGITVDLTGNTFISKAGVTSSTFASIPDVPVSSFELSLPQGKYSALAANGNLCAQKLAMPTEFLAHNGVAIHTSTPIAVEGCPNTITVTSHSLKGRNLTVSVSVPAAGKLAATGRGLSKAAKTAKGRETLKLTIHAAKNGKLTTSVKLTFTPTTGKDRKKLTRSVAVRIKK